MMASENSSIDHSLSDFCPTCGSARNRTLTRSNKGPTHSAKRRQSASSTASSRSAHGLCKCSTKMKDIIFALLVRALFAAHGLIGIWRAQTEWDMVELWLLLIPVGILLLEALFTVGIRGGEEYKWASPCVLLYLCSIVPSIWFLELKNYELRQGHHYCSNLYWGNVTIGCALDFQSNVYTDLDTLATNRTQLKLACDLERDYRNELQRLRANFTAVSTVPATTSAGFDDQSTGTTKAPIDGLGGDVVNTIEDAKKALDNLLSGVNIFDRTTWVLVLHQLLLFILIIGRWLLPTGEGISRDELSQLLLVFIGVGADILEFVTETIKEVSVRCDRLVVICIMAFWSWSTLQFTLVITAAQARKSRAVGIYEEEGQSSRAQSPVVVVEDDDKNKGALAKFFSNTEVWGILSTLILQDGPFLGMRLYIMIGKGVIHQMIVFFTCKNCLVFVLQLYRLSIIATSKKDNEEEESAMPVSAGDNLNSVRALIAAQANFKKALKKPEGSTGKVAPTNDKQIPEA